MKGDIYVRVLSRVLLRYAYEKSKGFYGTPSWICVCYMSRNDQFYPLFLFVCSKHGPNGAGPRPRNAVISLFLSHHTTQPVPLSR